MGYIVHCKGNQEQLLDIYQWCKDKPLIDCWNPKDIEREYSKVWSGDRANFRPMLDMEIENKKLLLLFKLAFGEYIVVVLFNNRKIDIDQLLAEEVVLNDIVRGSDN